MEPDEHKTQPAPVVNSCFMENPPPRADIDEILRRKRKAREYKV